MSYTTSGCGCFHVWHSIFNYCTVSRRFSFLHRLWTRLKASLKVSQSVSLPPGKIPVHYCYWWMHNRAARCSRERNQFKEHVQLKDRESPNWCDRGRHVPKRLARYKLSLGQMGLPTRSHRLMPESLPCETAHVWFVCWRLSVTFAESRHHWSPAGALLAETKK